jgi:hypothetical protein
MSIRHRWKSFERRTAERLHGTRRPVTGIDRADGDVFTAMFEVQCKLRPQPGFLNAWLSGICATASARNRIGIVVWKSPGSGKPDGDALVIMRWRDFVDLHGEVADEETPTPL